MLPARYLTFSQCEVLTLLWQIEASKPMLKCWTEEEDNGRPE